MSFYARSFQITHNSYLITKIDGSIHFSNPCRHFDSNRIAHGSFKESGA